MVTDPVLIHCCKTLPLNILYYLDKHHSISYTISSQFLEYNLFVCWDIFENKHFWCPRILVKILKSKKHLSQELGYVFEIRVRYQSGQITRAELVHSLGFRYQAKTYLFRLNVSCMSLLLVINITLLMYHATSFEHECTSQCLLNL